MNKRPRSITMIGWVFICVGCASAVGGLLRFVDAAGSGRVGGPPAWEPVDLSLVLASAILAVVGGVFVLRGFNWARWLCVIWMGLHVVLSLWHPPLELITHSVLFVAILCLLWRSPASTYFRGARC